MIAGAIEISFSPKKIGQSIAADRRTPTTVMIFGVIRRRLSPRAMLYEIASQPFTAPFISAPPCRALHRE
jgi:hypothetical protein